MDLETTTMMVAIVMLLAVICSKAAAVNSLHKRGVERKKLDWKSGRFY